MLLEVPEGVRQLLVWTCPEQTKCFLEFPWRSQELTPGNYLKPFMLHIGHHKALSAGN